MDILAHMRTFARVVEAGSFTAVAREIKTTQPTVSRQVAALEAHLGVRLFTRTTRALALTDDGREYYTRAKTAIEVVAEAEEAVGRGRGQPSGLLRLACPVVFGRLQILPRLDRFMRRHPAMRVELIMHDGFTDLIEEGVDLAIRIGEITGPGLVARRIGTTRRVTVASPEYIERNGWPNHPDDLRGHECIVYTGLATGHNWRFEGTNGPLVVPVSGRYLVNNSEGVREGVLRGLGIAVVPVWVFGDEIDAGRALVLLKDYEPLKLPIHAVYGSRRFLPAKVRAMIEYLAQEFAREPKLSDEK